MTTTHLNSRNVTFCQPSSFVSLTSVALFQLFRCVARAIVLRAWGQVISNHVPLSCSTRHLHHCHGIAFAFLTAAFWLVKVSRKAPAQRHHFMSQVSSSHCSCPFRSSSPWPPSQQARGGRVGQPRHMTFWGSLFPPIFSASLLPPEKPLLVFNHYHDVAHTSDKTCLSS